MEGSGAQVVIPDLDDDDEIFPLPNLDNKSGGAGGAGGAGASASVPSPSGPSRGPFRGTELNFHNRSGSATGSGTSEEWESNLLSNSLNSGFATTHSNSSSNQSQYGNVATPTSHSNHNKSEPSHLNSSSNTPTPSASSYRFPPSNPNPPSASSFSFPRKASFASLKAAIKGQSNASSSNVGGNVEGSQSVGASVGGASVVSSALDAFPSGMAMGGSATGHNSKQSGPDTYGMSGSSRRGGLASSGAVGGPVNGRSSRPSSPSASKFNVYANTHGRQASYFSEQSTGAASSSADSQGQSQGGAPPLPPFPEAFGQSANPFQNHGRQHSNSSSAANANPFNPTNFSGAHTNFTRGRASNERDRGEGDQGLSSPFLGGGSGFSALSSSSRFGHGMMTGASGRPRPSQPFNQRQDSFDAASLDLVPVQSLEASSISDPISPSSYRNPIPSGVHRSIHDGARTPTVPGASSRAGPSATSPYSQFGLEDQGLGTLPKGIGTPDPSTPAEYAMNILMSRYISLAGFKIQAIMERNVSSDPNLPAQLGHGRDSAFDSLLESLAHMAKKNAKQILDSLFCWRSLVRDSAVDAAMVRKSMVEIHPQSGGANASSSSVMGSGANAAASSSVSSSSSINFSNTSVKEAASKLTRRKNFTTLYILSRVLIQISKQLSKSSLSESDSSALEREVFEMLKECTNATSNNANVAGMMKEREKDKERDKAGKGTEAAPSGSSSSLGMQSTCFEIVSELIGEISRTQFASVGDRFISALEQSSKARTAANSAGSVSKEKDRDLDATTEATIQAMKDLNITIYPLEAFEEGAEFIEVLSRFFAASHGHRIKSAYAQTLTHLLLRVARSASAEVNHPTWAKAVETIWPRAVAMSSKPRYWSVAYPLYVSLLCVSTESKLMSHWFPAVEMGFAKLKDRGHRNIVLNAAVRLLWVYVFRCQESTNATAKRLDAFFRLWFPASRRNVTPAEGSHTAHVLMLHFVLFRHFDYGRDLILDFLRSTALSGNTLSLQPDVLSRSRMTIAIRAILLTLDSYVKGEQPSFPEGADFDASDFEEATSASGNELSRDFSFPTGDIGAAQDKFNDLIGKIALICEHQVSDVNVFDERILLLRGNGGAAPTSVSGASSDKALVEREGLIWRTHSGSNFTVAYVRDHQPYFDLLHACFQSWPRCLSSNLSFSTVLSILFRSHFSADPLVAEASSETLRRIAQQRKGGATAVVSGFMRWIFRPETIFWEVHHDQILLLPKVEQAVSLWIEFLNFWLSELRESRADGDGPAMKGMEMERTSAWAIIDEVEAYGLLLLCSGWQPLRRQASLILKVVAALDETFLSPARRQSLAAARQAGEEEPSRIIHLLNKPCANYCDEADPHLSPAQQSRASKWRRASNAEALSDLAQSQNSVEHSLWQHVLPRFLRMCLEYFPTTVAVFRSHVTNRVPSMDQAVAHAAGTTPRMPAGGAGGGGGALGTISNSNGGNKSSAVTSLTADQVLMAEHWKLYILALCTTTTSTEGSRGAVAMGHRRQSSESGSERVIAARDLFQKLVPFLASDQSRFRDAVITALGNINSNLYRALLETMQAVCSQLNEDWRARSMGRAGQKRSRRHERLRTAIGHVILLTTPHLAKGSVLDDEGTVQILLGWTRDTYNFLNDREIKSDSGFNRLRRFLCGIVEQLFDGITSRGDVDNYFDYEFRAKLFRTFRDWHALSQAGEEGPGKFAEMLSSAAAQYRDESQRDHALSAINRLRAEVEQLSFRAGSAMASLCQSSISGTSASSSSSTEALEAGSLFSWLENLFSNPSSQTHPIAKRAMRALLLYNDSHSALISKAVEHSFREPERISSGRSFFVVLTEAILERETIKIPLHQAFCLALVKLGHPDREIRRKAFAMLDHVARSQKPESVLNELEAGVGSPLPAIYLRAQRDVSMYLAKIFRPIRAEMLSEYTARLPVIDRARRATTLGLLPEWLKDHDLLEKTSLDYEQEKQRPSQQFAGAGGYQDGPLYSTHLILTNLLFLTIKYSDDHNFEIQDMWASLATSEKLILNANVIIKFLVEQALKHKCPAFVINAKRVISCLSNTVIGPHMFDELCSLIDPGSMIPVPHEGDFSSVDAALRDLHLANLGQALPPTSRKHTFSPGQLALFFVGELTYERSEQLGSHLPVLLHSIFMQIDSSSAFVQDQATSIFEQMMRSLISGAPPSILAKSKEEKDTVQSSHEKPAKDGKARVEQLFSNGMSIWWTIDSVGAELDETRTPRSMRSTLSETLSILEPLYPDLREKWGTVALVWATSGPVRHLACRSFQAFRVLLPLTTASMLANMLGRLSNTVSDPNPDIQSFALEILHTLKAVIRATQGSQHELFCQTFWATVACLSTINEEEFAEAIAMLDSLLDKIDIGSTETVEMLRLKCPEGWEGEPGGIQSLVLRGLKSSVTSDPSFSILNRLARIRNPALIDSSDGRLGFLFVAALPWFLYSTDQAMEERDENVFALAESIASLAEESGKKDLHRVATSIAKSRFRTKDDLIRQAVGCVKSNYLPSLGPDLAVLLLGLTLNEKEWMRRQTMQVLKIFFQVIDTRSEDFANLGSELLMPLLRLLSTPLSSQALEVLDEPIVINGGPAANQILRMSLQWGNNGSTRFNSNQRREQASDASIFGAPDDSGWAVAHPQDLTTRTRINVQAVFKTCELTLDVTPIDSNVNFVVDDDFELDEEGSEFEFPQDQGIIYREDQEADETASVGDLVNQLHDLSSFFVDDPPSNLSESSKLPHTTSNGSVSLSHYPHTSNFKSDPTFNQTSLVAKILGNSAFSPPSSRENNLPDSSSRGGAAAELGDHEQSIPPFSSSPKNTGSLTPGREEGGSDEGRKMGWGRRALFKRKDSYGSSNVKHQG